MTSNRSFSGFALSTESGVEPTEIQLIREGLVRVPLRSATLPPATHTSTYLVRGTSDWWIYDLGAGDEASIDRLDQSVRLFCGAWDAVAGLVLSHHHPDHVGGLGAWVERIKRPVYAHFRTIEHLQSYGFPEAPDWRWTADNDKLDGLHFLHTPGHASGHLALLTPEKELIGGDLTAGIGTIVIDLPDGNMRNYLDSLDRVMKLSPTALFPSHGPESHDTSERLSGYISHRLARERKILDAIVVEPRPLSRIMTEAYDNPSELIAPLAIRSTMAHVEKLLEDRLVLADERGWISRR
jgi:ribonuclease/clavin/mitogillin